MIGKQNNSKVFGSNDIKGQNKINKIG